MKPQSSKAKGRRFQQDIASDIRSAFQIETPDAVSTAMGQAGTDIKLSTAARHKFPFAVECKCVERLNVWESWQQAETNGIKEQLFPLLLIRKNNHKPLAVLDWDLLLEILRHEPKD